jgi:hypothetical protein
MNRKRFVKSSRCAAAAICGVAMFATGVSAAFVTVWGGPAYDQTTQTGYQNTNLPSGPGCSAGNGVAVGSAEKFTGGTFRGSRAVRWDVSGVSEMGNLGTDGSGFTYSGAFAVNSAGAAAGNAYKYNGGMSFGLRAVRWDASGTTATELGNLGTTIGGITSSNAYAINTAGAAVGWAQKFTAGSNRGTRAVRWEASGTAATELGNLGTGSTGFTDSQALAINAAGTAIGWADKHTGGTLVGSAAVRWDSGSTAATELGGLGNGSGGFASSYPNAINTAGTVVGQATKSSGGTNLGDRAVRWNASGTTATELGNLGTDSSGVTNSNAYAINTAGTAVGGAEKYTGGGIDLGTRAVRWDASGTAAIELGNLGTDGNGITNSYAYAVNSAGVAVGVAEKYSGGTNLGYRPVLWNSNGVAIDLNTLIDPAIGWTLNDAVGISDTNWVTGIGSFDPDGAGPLNAYQRAFLLDASALHLPFPRLSLPAAVPEPGSLSVVLLIGVCTASLRLRRRNASPRNAARRR